MTWENPLGLKRIHHLVLASGPNSEELKDKLTIFGFSVNGIGENKDVLYGQGQVRFILSENSDIAKNYYSKHGQGFSSLCFEVKDADKALKSALKSGAKQVYPLQTYQTESGVVKKSAISGVGDIVNEFIEFVGEAKDIPGIQRAVQDYPGAKPLPVRFSRIDHLTNNVPYGEMDHWVDYYKRVFGFVETRYFDIKGDQTRLYSKVVQSPDNSIIVPINEPDQSKSKSQIQEFLDINNGHGVQHIALMTPDISKSVGELKNRGIDFLNVDDDYYDEIPQRPFTIKEDISDLQSKRILVDGDEDGYLLQIFTKNMIGPFFFEVIQRRNHWGFGHGNFKALFKSIERDQLKRGYLD